MRSPEGEVVDFYSLKPLPELFVPNKSADPFSRGGAVNTFVEPWSSESSSKTKYYYSKLLTTLSFYNYEQTNTNYEDAIKAINVFRDKCSVEDRDDFCYATLVNYKELLTNYHKRRKQIDIRARECLRVMGELEKIIYGFALVGNRKPLGQAPIESLGVYENSLPETVIRAINSINEDSTGYDELLNFFYEHIDSYSKAVKWLYKNFGNLQTHRVKQLKSSLRLFELEVFFYQE